MYLMAACSIRLRPVIAKFVERTHLKNLYNRVSQKMSSSSGQESNIKLGTISSPLEGFKKIQKRDMEHTLLVENTRSE